MTVRIRMKPEVEALVRESEAAISVLEAARDSDDYKTAARTLAKLVARLLEVAVKSGLEGVDLPL